MGKILFFYLPLFFLATTAEALEFQKVEGKAELRLGEFLTTNSQYPMNMGQGILRAQTGVTQGSWALKLAPALTVNKQDLQKTSEVRSHFKSSEIWGDYTSNIFDLALGFQAMKWGAADGYNPTNGFRAYDLSDPVHPRELSQNAVTLKLHPGAEQKTVFEVTYVPQGLVDVLPFELKRGSIDPESSRWGIVLPTAVDLGQGSQIPLKYRMENERFNNSSDVGARLRFLQIGNWDYSLAFGQFRRKRAILQYQLTGDANDPALPLTVVIKPLFARYQMLGADASGTIGDYGVRLEVAKNIVQKDDRAFGYDSLQANGGVDRLFTSLFGEVDLYVNAFYVHIKNHYYQAYDSQSIDLSFTRSYGNLKTELRWPKVIIGQDLLLTVDRNSVYNLYTKYEWSERVNLGLTGSFLNGNVDTGLGRLSRNHRLIAHLEYFF
jgi:hypothetical protein